MTLSLSFRSVSGLLHKSFSLSCATSNLRTQYLAQMQTKEHEWIEHLQTFDLESICFSTLFNLIVVMYTFSFAVLRLLQHLDDLRRLHFHMKNYEGQKSA
jgi:hypothetical protein